MRSIVEKFLFFARYIYEFLSFDEKRDWESEIPFPCSIYLRIFATFKSNTIPFDEKVEKFFARYIYEFFKFLNLIRYLSTRSVIERAKFPFFIRYIYEFLQVLNLIRYLLKVEKFFARYLFEFFEFSDRTHEWEISSTRGNRANPIEIKNDAFGSYCEAYLRNSFSFLSSNFQIQQERTSNAFLDTKRELERAKFPLLRYTYIRIFEIVRSNMKFPFDLRIMRIASK